VILEEPDGDLKKEIPVLEPRQYEVLVR